MRIARLVSVLIFACMLATAGRAEELQATTASGETVAVSEKEPAGVMRPIPTGNDRRDGDAPEGLDEQEDAQTDSVLPSYESYDQDTGFPDAVPSDKTGNLE